MATVWYRWSEKGKPDRCEQKEIITKADRLCYHCGKVIPAGEKAVWLLTERGENYVLHEKCAKESCAFQ